MGIVISLMVNALAFYVVSYLIPGVVIEGWQSLLVVAVLWGVLSVLVRPVIVVLTLPINVVTLGLFSFVINAGLLLLMARLVAGFDVAGFGTALLAAVVLAVVNMFLGGLK